MYNPDLYNKIVKAINKFNKKIIKKLLKNK